MAKINDLLGDSEGTLEKLVIYRMKGNIYFRQKPEKYNDRKSPAQLAQRQRLQVVNSFLRPFREIIRLTFASEAKGRSALQAAQSYIMRNAMAGGYPNIHVDKNKALLSRGPLPLPLSVSAETNAEGVLIRWQNGKEAAGKAINDTLIVISLFEGDEVAGFQDTGVKRSAGQFLWKLPNPVKQGAMPDVWIAFRNAEMTKVSDSLYSS